MDVLVVDGFCRVIPDGLPESITFTSSPSDARRLIADLSFGIVFVAVSLDDTRRDFLEWRRDHKPSLPVVCIAASATPHMVVDLLSGGANALAVDLLIDPDVQEVLDAAYMYTRSLRCGPFHADLVAKEASCDGRTINLPGQRFDIFVFLMRRCGEWVTYNDISRSLGKDVSGDEAVRALKTTMWRIRKNVKNAARRDAIHYGQNQGFCLDPGS